MLDYVAFLSFKTVKHWYILHATDLDLAADRWNKTHLGLFRKAVKNSCKCSNYFLNHCLFRCVNILEHIIKISISQLLKVSHSVLAVVRNNIKEEARTLKFYHIVLESIDFIICLTCLMLWNVCKQFSIGHQNILDSLWVINCWRIQFFLNSDESLKVEFLCKDSGSKNWAQSSDNLGLCNTKDCLFVIDFTQLEHSVFNFQSRCLRKHELKSFKKSFCFIFSFFLSESP